MKVKRRQAEGIFQLYFHPFHPTIFKGKLDIAVAIILSIHTVASNSVCIFIDVY